MNQTAQQESNSENIVVIGRGKVGQSLTQAFAQQGFAVNNIGRSLLAQTEAVEHADIVLICVDDASIQSVCDQLAPSFKTDCVVCHCSGSLDSQVLLSAKLKGCSIASTHPLNTFPNLEDSLLLFSSDQHGSYLYVEGDDQALQALLPTFETIGFTCLTIERDAKPLYHAACVFASNYLVSLMDMSLESAAAAGLDRRQFWLSLQPIIRATIENIGHKGISESLSGPIARGEHSIVSAHVQHLNKQSESLKNNYVDLGLRALKIAIEKDELSTKQLDALRKTLNKTR